MLQGRRLDWCLRWAQGCGKPAADAYCVANGYENATSFQIDADIGRTSPTMVMATGQVCSDAFCDGFLRISCRKRIAARGGGGQQGVQIWKLTRREYPVLPAYETRATAGRNAGSYMKIERFGPRNSVSFIHRGMAHGQSECLAVSSYKWSDNRMPTQIATGTKVAIDLDAGVDRMQGRGCGVARIGVAFGSRAEPLFDRASNVVADSQLMARPYGPRRTTNVFSIRPSRSGVDLFTVAIYITDGGSVRRVVALYVYEKVRRY